jgi:glycosyltransferase involved in cell wall biosynthesis
MVRQSHRGEHYNGVSKRRLESGRGTRHDELLDELGIPKDSFLCVFAGRLAPQKGLKYLVEAVGIVKSKMPDRQIHLAVIGEGELEQSLRSQVRELNISDRVHLLGFQSDCLRWTGGCDLFVLSSLWEGHSITLLEAMGLGRPIVVTDIKGNRETITHNKDGLHVPPADSEALALAMMDIASHPERATQMGQAAAETFERNFTEEVMKEKSWKVYQEVLSAKGLL